MANLSGLQESIFDPLNGTYLNPPKKYKGSCLDGRDITYNIVPDADFKFLSKTWDK